MKKLILATCVAAFGVPVSAQQAPAPAPPAPAADLQQAPPAQAQQSKSNVDYGYYGGPTTPPQKSLGSKYSTGPHTGPNGPYKLYGVPDDLSAAELEAARVRDAAVEFGRFRRQFTGSTQFWMDEHRTELAKSRYAMDESMWRSVHPAEAFGPGGYLYHAADFVGSEAWAPSRPVIAATPARAPAPIVNTPPAEVTPASAAPRTTTPAPRVIAGDKPVYDAAASVGRPTK
jgi:hypothetical protein